MQVFITFPKLNAKSIEQRVDMWESQKGFIVNSKVNDDRLYIVFHFSSVCTKCILSVGRLCQQTVSGAHTR